MNRALLRLYFSLNVVLLVMLLLALPFIDFGSPAGTVAKLNLLILVPSSLVSGALLYREVRMRENHPHELEDLTAEPPFDPARDEEASDRELPWEE